jgi:hypothetical protein
VREIGTAAGRPRFLGEGLIVRGTDDQQIGRHGEATAHFRESAALALTKHHVNRHDDAEAHARTAVDCLTAPVTTSARTVPAPRRPRSPPNWQPAASP